ncbi:hypothetical protein I5Q34_32450 [Streptomyces sp. AV19]|uniref:DUF6183 family protein n=1 Tax=Streptomyces sp. AV19 TaxID=2793068 RepID=UPI0018FE4F9B|nr:DUF6183 family protein [Streptomyces sp. AV19]MBH1938917.1 hypothetical protein [Streptomyces sp. AV19]MDG4533324.1 DUF6183 family protein [Streptomyces sp. AV19]
MSHRIQKTVTRLPGMKTVTEVWEAADRSLAEGDIAFVADLGIALSNRYGSSATRVWQYGSVFNRLLRLLTSTPGREHVEQALRLVSAAASADRKLPRYAASLLAAGQTPENLAVVFTGGSSRAGASEELRACLVHELVLRGVAVGETPGIAGWARSPHWRHHPLGRLPLALGTLEETPSLPSCSAGGASCSLPYGQQDGGPGPAPGGTAHVPTATGTTTEAFRSAVAAATANWADESNGRIEAGTYDLAAPVGTDGLPGLLVTLGLECFDGVGRRNRLALSSRRPEEAWHMLFAAASTGGAYNHGMYGAYGRLAAWRSLAALSGAAADAAPDDVARQARDCAWYDFGGATKWFTRVAWDIGLVTVAPGRRRLAVLAATDTD